ncbi:MAG: tetratricopeptide repeat protein [Gammaproteobacteria bacterium SHHR-1]
MRYRSSALLLALLSCPAATLVAAAEAVAEPFQAPPAQLGELNAEVVFNVLAGEVAAHRHQLEQAFAYTRKAASQTGDARLAERSARLALFNKDQQALQEVVGFWVERDPNSLEARRFALSVALEMGSEGEVERQLNELITLAQAKGEDGFILVARALSKSKEPQRSIDLMQGLVQRQPEGREAWYALALLAAEHKDFSRAEQALQELLQRAPVWDKAISLKVQVLLGQGQKAQALQLLREAVSAAAEDLELRHALARLLVQMEQYQEAYDQYQQLLQRQPDNLTLRYPLGVLAMELKKFDQAEQHFRQIKDSRGRRDEASYYLGRIAEQREDLATAVDWYRRVLGSEFQLQAQIRAADLLARLGELEQARAALAAAREQWPEQAVAIYVTEIAVLKEHEFSAEQIWQLFEQALREHPEHIDLLYARALFAAAQGQVRQLEQDLTQVLRQNPKHADALNALGYTLADLTERHQEALGYIRQALELKPNSPAVLDSMGWVQYRLGNLDQALDYLRRAAEKVTDPEINAHLGEVLWVKGERQQALRAWGQVLGEFSDHPVLRATLERLGVNAAEIEQIKAGDTGAEAQ